MAADNKASACTPDTESAVGTQNQGTSLLLLSSKPDNNIYHWLLKKRRESMNSTLIAHSAAFPPMRQENVLILAKWTVIIIWRIESISYIEALRREK